MFNAKSMNNINALRYVIVIVIYPKGGGEGGGKGVYKTMERPRIWFEVLQLTCSGQEGQAGGEVI